MFGASPVLAMATNDTDGRHHTWKQSDHLKSQVEFYASLSRLADQIKTGIHPSIKLLSNTSTTDDTNKVARGSTAYTRPTLSLDDAASCTAETQLPLVLSAQRNQTQLSSDAESFKRSLEKRRRIEESLLDQVERKKAQVRERDLLENPQAIDPQEILAAARKVVLPLSGLHLAHTESHGGISTDDESYYSSQANVWSSEDGEVKVERAKPAEDVSNADQNEIHASNANAYQNRPSNGQESGGAPTSRKNSQQTLDHGTNLRRVSQVSMREHLQASIHDRQHKEGNLMMSGMDVTDHREESYSPPAADAFRNISYSQPVPTADLAADRDAVSGLAHRNHNRNFSNANSLSVTPQIGSSSNLASTFLNASASHIDEPDLLIHESTSGIPGAGESTGDITSRSEEQSKRRPPHMHSHVPRQTPGNSIEGSSLVLAHHHRKRERAYDTAESTQEPFGKRAARLPVQYLDTPPIKLEPQSPLSLSNAPPRRLKLRNDGNVDVDCIAAPPTIDSRHVHLRNQGHEPRYYESSPYLIHPAPAKRHVSDQYYYQVDRPEVSLITPIDERRVFSPMSISERYLPSSRRDPIDSPSLYPRPIHLASNQQQSMREYYWRDASQPDMVRPETSMAYSRHQTAIPPSAVPIGESYQVAGRAASHVMNYHGHKEWMDRGEGRFLQPTSGPPSRRIVRDQYGNEYIALPAVSKHHYSSAPVEPHLTRRAVSYHPMLDPRDTNILHDVEEI